MNRIISSFLLICLSTVFFTVNAQIVEPVKWSYKVNALSDKEFEIIFTASIEKNWHLYSTQIPTDDPDAIAPVPTGFYFEDNDNIVLVDEIIEKSKLITKFDENFEMDLSYFANEAVFVQKVKIQKPTQLVGFIEFMCCDDTRCIPPAEFDFSINLPPSDSVAVISDGSTDSPIGSKSFIGFLIIAFLAGLAALLTPCVFPMIPMTVSYFLQGQTQNAKGIRNAMVFGLSIIIVYTAIGALIALIFGPNFANWISTHWIPNIIFFLIFVIFSFSFFGLFELTLPSWMVNKADKQADKGGSLGAFFLALTTVLVSFACTGPIVGAILLESIEGNLLKPILGMMVFGFAFAIPFTILAIFPKWLSNMPKSGGWLNSIKVVLGFIVLAFGLKFLSMADTTYHWGILNREVYLAIWIVIFSFMGFYLLGKLKLAHDSDVPYISVTRLMLAIATFSFVVYLIPGLFGAPLKPLSGLLPAQYKHSFDINEIIRKEVEAIKLQGVISSDQPANVTEADCGIPKYGDFLKLPHGLKGYFDLDQGLECAREQNKAVFLEFTGHACSNCKEMEAKVWSDPAVLKLLREEFVIIALYVDERKKMDEQDWYESVTDGKVKNTIGKKSSDIQISKFKVNAQPCYFILDHDGNQMSKAYFYNLKTQDFINFLQDGISKFKENQKVEETDNPFKMGGI